MNEHKILIPNCGRKSKHIIHISDLHQEIPFGDEEGAPPISSDFTHQTIEN